MLTPVDLAPEKLIDTIKRARFGSSEQSKNNEAFFRELSRYQRLLEHDGNRTVSISAISNWVVRKTSMPKRVDAMRFLAGYMTWIENNKYIVDYNSFLIASKYLRGYAVKIDSKKDDTDFSNKQKLSLLAGSYQLIRPYVGRKNSYVLEALTLNNSDLGVNKGISMYGHNYPELKFIYKGDINISGVGFFSLLKRKSDDEKGFSFRLISIHVQNLAHNKDIRCLSGILTRGVGALNVRRMIVAMPFIAIRFPRKNSTMYTEEYESISPNLSKRGSLFIGDIDKEQRNMHVFCERIFKKLNIQDGVDADYQNRNNVFETISPEKLENIIHSGEEYSTSAFNLWWKAVRGDLHIDGSSR